MSHSINRQAFKETCDCHQCSAPLTRFPMEGPPIGSEWRVDDVVVSRCPHCEMAVESDYYWRGMSETHDGILTPTSAETGTCESCGTEIQRWVWPGQRWHIELPPAPEIDAQKLGENAMYGDDEVEFVKITEYGVAGKDGRLFAVEVTFRDKTAHLEVDVSGTAESMLEIPIEDAVRDRVRWELEQIANDEDWTEVIGQGLLALSSTHVEGGIGRTS